MKRFACLSLFIAAFCWSVFAAVAEQKPAPSLSEDEKVLVLPYQYYYFLEAVDADGESKQQLHCYYPNTGVRSNEFHSGIVGFFFLGNDILSSLVMR